MVEDEKYMENVMTAEKFSLEVVRRHHEYGDVSLLDVVLECLKENNIDELDARPLISKTLMERLYNEAMNNNMLKDKSTSQKLVY